MAQIAPTNVTDSPGIAELVDEHGTRARRLIPCFLGNSAIPTPASPSFKIDTICDSVNLDFFMSSPVMQGESIIHCVRGGGANGL